MVVRYYIGWGWAWGLQSQNGEIVCLSPRHKTREEARRSARAFARLLKQAPKIEWSIASHPTG
jgi:hypothetical protein